jgi:hypothetical protein
VFILGGDSVLSAAVDSLTVCGAAPMQAITITPDTGLTDGQSVHIVATGFKPGVEVGVSECGPGMIGNGNCNGPGAQFLAADALGTVTLDFIVVKGPFGTNNILCGPAQQCDIFVSTFQTGDPFQFAQANISFA